MIFLGRGDKKNQNFKFYKKDKNIIEIVWKKMQIYHKLYIFSLKFYSNYIIIKIFLLFKTLIIFNIKYMFW